ncbi:MAG: hypothetical protein K8F91_27305 [Candidatus Obscuribacterales bacterium]|nr:hypothetical protein [Candidatus Obscuribacterales bacterium]
MNVMTVLGEIDPAELKTTLVHEHLLIDLTCLLEATNTKDDLQVSSSKVTSELRQKLVKDPYLCRDNLLLTDTQLAISELSSFRALGGSTIVDLSTRTIGPYPQELVAIARQSGINIIAGSGFYIQKAHPDWLADAQREEIAEFFIEEITNGFDASGIRPGIIGELGTSKTITPDEKKVLEAAALAHLATGLAINVHLSIFERQGHNVLDILDKAGADLQKVVLSHLDESLDYPYIESLAKRGAYVALDTFGSDFCFSRSGKREPTDWQRIDLLIKLLEAGLTRRILISQDVCNKIHLKAYGGAGYSHILETIVPELISRGIDQSIIDTILIENPRTMLTGKNKPPTNAVHISGSS